MRRSRRRHCEVLWRCDREECSSGHLVRAARQEEIKFLNTFSVHKKGPGGEREEQGARVVRWCDVDWGDSDHMAVQSRLFWTRVSVQGSVHAGTFAATPFWESLRYVLHWVDDDMSGSWTSSCSCWRYPKHMSSLPVARKLYISLLDEDAGVGMIGLLLRKLYGTRDVTRELKVFANFKIATIGGQSRIGQSIPLRARTESSEGWRLDILFSDEEESWSVSMTSWVMRWSSRNELRSDWMKRTTNTAQFTHDMTKPTIRHLSCRKGALRYLKMHGRYVKTFRLQDTTSLIHIFTDTDWDEW